MTVEEEAVYLQKARDSDLGLYLVAETEGMIVATCALSIDSHLRERHKARFGIAVQRAYWSMGIGRKLMEAMIAWCRRRGLVKIELTVDTGNQRALSLYGSLGFVTEGTLRKSSRLGDGTYRDAYAMALFLDNSEAEKCRPFRCLIREIREESGIETEVVRLVGICSNTGSHPGYDGYDLVPPKLILDFVCRVKGGTLRESAETSGNAWVPKEKVLEWIHSLSYRTRFEAYLRGSDDISYMEYVTHTEFRIRQERKM